MRKTFSGGFRFRVAVYPEIATAQSPYSLPSGWTFFRKYPVAIHVSNSIQYYHPILQSTLLPSNYRVIYIKQTLLTSKYRSSNIYRVNVKQCLTTVIQRVTITLS